MGFRRGLIFLVLVLPVLGCTTREQQADEAFARGSEALDQHQYDTAIAEFTEAIRLDPQDDAAYFNRGYAYDKKKEYAKAVSDYRESVRLAPDDPDGYSNLAWLLATCPEDGLRDGKRAVELATRACELSGWTDANDIENLAAAHAEDRRFDEAVRWQTKALDVMTGLPSLNDARERLALYKRGTPFRDK
jgi:Flp pilus assembly protein TadD